MALCISCGSRPRDVGEDPALGGLVDELLSSTSITAITGQVDSWTIRSIICRPFVFPSWTITRATSGCSAAVICATSSSDDSRATTS